jgi:signal transduction histidine kinase
VERVRIAHELHDTVAHSVTVMTLQAAGAKTLVRRDPGRAEEALTHVGGAGAAAMSELRRMLTALRADGSTGPGLHSVDDLVAGVRTAGVDVTVDCDGEPTRPAPAADLAAYRVIQEALTNVAKHAGPGTRATVTMRWLPGRLHIEVTDDGAGRPTGDAASLSTGHGLAGLAERIAGLGGRLEAGTAAGAGFRVSATVPMEDAGARAAG